MRWLDPALLPFRVTRSRRRSQNHSLAGESAVISGRVILAGPSPRSTVFSTFLRPNFPSLDSGLSTRANQPLGWRKLALRPARSDGVSTTRSRFRNPPLFAAGRDQYPLRFLRQRFLAKISKFLLSASVGKEKLMFCPPECARSLSPEWRPRGFAHRIERGRIGPHNGSLPRDVRGLCVWEGFVPVTWEQRRLCFE